MRATLQPEWHYLKKISLMTTAVEVRLVWVKSAYVSIPELEGQRVAREVGVRTEHRRQQWLWAHDVVVAKECLGQEASAEMLGHPQELSKESE